MNLIAAALGLDMTNNSSTDKGATILVVCPSHRDHRELSLAAGAGGHRLLFHDYASIELEEMVAPSSRRIAIPPVHEEIERIVAAASKSRIDAVVSTDDYPGSTLAAIVAQRLGLPGTPVASNLLCQHKFQSRLVQQRAQPDAVPDFEMLGLKSKPRLTFPFFIKPVKSFFSVGAYRVENEGDLRTFVPKATLPQAFLTPFGALLEGYAGVSFGHQSVLAESLITGSQATFEGYAFGGRIHSVGIVDSIMYPGTNSFERFEYPSALSEEVQNRMEVVAGRVMRAAGFSHGLFNIEFCYDASSDKLCIVEINPRMASQFADLYEKVDGTNTYTLLLDLALGHRPAVTHRAGSHAVAASCVLRRFEDAHVSQVPSEADLESVSESHPDVRIEVLASRGAWLSQQLQDGNSFRYGIVNLGSRSHGELLAAFDWCRRRLPFSFERQIAPSSASQCA